MPNLSPPEPWWKPELPSDLLRGYDSFFFTFCGMSLAQMNRLLPYSFRQIGLGCRYGAGCRSNSSWEISSFGHSCSNDGGKAGLRDISTLTIPLWGRTYGGYLQLDHA